MRADREAASIWIDARVERRDLAVKGLAGQGVGIDLHEAGRLASTCADGRCDEMAIDLLPRILERRAEVVRAPAELDHLDAQLGRLEQALRAGANELGICTEKGADDDSAGDDSDGDRRV